MRRGQIFVGSARKRDAGQNLPKHLFEALAILHGVEHEAGVPDMTHPLVV